MKSRVNMKKKYGINMKLHDRIMLNNILHDMSTINGLEINVKNFQAINGKDFAGIKDLIAWNKRQQIVMNTSYPADATFIRKQMNLKPDENLKFKVIKTKQTKNKQIKIFFKNELFVCVHVLQRKILFFDQ